MLCAASKIIVANRFCKCLVKLQYYALTSTCLIIQKIKYYNQSRRKETSYKHYNE